MSLVTIGLDFGTSSIKCVARPSMGQPRVLRSPTGAVRWRSMLGRVREGDEAGRLLLFEECDLEQWRFGALLEPNLKLALLVGPNSPAADALRSRWACDQHYALPTLLLAAAVRHALLTVKAEWPNRAIHIFCGAPVSPTHPPEQTMIFERALHAANSLAVHWGSQVPMDARTALLEAEEAWMASAELPSEEDRITFVVPEAFAACEGVATAGGGASLPIGRLCVVDMGGGTTDIAWVTRQGSDAYNPLRIDSIDVAGERLEAVIATEASRQAGRRVTRQEIWKARHHAPNGSDCTRGDGWSFTAEELHTVLRATMNELAQRFKRGLQQIDQGAMRAPPTKFVFVGGATRWAPLQSLFEEEVRGFHERTELVTVGEYGLTESVGDAPMAVALGLSNGHTTLDLERWGSALRVPTTQAIREPIESLKSCACRGLLPCCPKCGGSGIESSEDGRVRFTASIDPFEVHAHKVRCPKCKIDFPRDWIFEHIRIEHPEPMVSPPMAPPQLSRLSLAVRIWEIRHAFLTGDSRGLNDPERVLLSELAFLRDACFSDAEHRSAFLTTFLMRSVAWSPREPWWHSPRAVAFAMLGATQDVSNELKQAEAADRSRVRQVESILGSDRRTRFAEALECAVR